jgi:hypothetical protein
MNLRLGSLAVGTSFILTFAGLAQAEPTATQKATAETLFQRGVSLAESGRVADACTQFDASLQIDPAIGTLFRLADCYDRVGRTASAWALFSEAQARARAAEQEERERMAAERVANLELRLSKLSFSVGDNAPAGLELRMNDVVVPRASWGLELPVDPGPQRLQLSAPGHRGWLETVVVEKGPSMRKLTLPTLTPEPVKAAPQPPLVAIAPPTPTKAADPERYPVWLGYAIGGVGLASVGVASVMGYRAYDLNQQSLDQCSRANANACTRQGDALRDDARKAGVLSTVFAVAGGALLAGGVTLTLFHGSKQEPRSATLQLSTRVSTNAALAGLVGAF